MASIRSPASGGSAGRRLPALVAVVVAAITAAAGCSTAGPSASSAAPSASPAPSVPVVSVGPSAPPSPPARPSPSSASAGDVVLAAKDAAIAALMAAIGNPDTDTPSEAMLAFEAAMASGDATRIRAAADVILGHVTDGRARLAEVSGPRCGAFCDEWDELLAHVADGVAAMRDGAADRAEPSWVEAVAEGRDLIQAGLLDHFWQAIRGDDPEAFVMRLPDGRTANASRARLSTPVAAALDGDPESAWTTGDAPAPQWIAIDVGAAADLRSVRMLTFQEADGQTEHRVSACGPDGIEVELARFAGATADRQWLEADGLDASDVRVVRVTTLAAPSPIGWREVEIGLADGAPTSSPGGSGPMALCGIVDLTDGATATGEPSLPGSEPALAIDGDPDTGWDAGQVGRLRLTLAASARITGIRVLDGAGGPTVWSITGILPGDQRMGLGQVTGDGEAGVWRSVPVDDPEAYREIELFVRSPTTVTEVVEIEVIGAPIR